MRAAVLGSGSFGTALANVLAQQCDPVWIWGRDEALIQELTALHENPRYLPRISLSPRVRGTVELRQALESADVVVSALPSHATREVLLRAAPLIPPSAPILSVTKGIENDSLMLMTEVMEAVLPERHHPYLAVLSGPSFAREMAVGLPTVVTIAAQWDRVAKRCQALFQTETFRVYTSPDVIGVQLGGALKNVIAIAAGISDGLQFGHNARSAIITRGLAEMTRLAVRMGANPLTLSGLAGLGDLVLTCTSDLSRNRQVGFELGLGHPLSQVMAGMRQVAEGVRTARSAKDLSARWEVELPICEQVYAIIQEEKSARDAVVELMTRRPKSELSAP